MEVYNVESMWYMVGSIDIYGRGGCYDSECDNDCVVVWYLDN